MIPLDVCVIGMHYAPEHTGNAPYTTGMVSALASAGHRVRVVTGYPHYPQWRVAEGYGGLRRRECLDGVPVVRVRHPVPTTPGAWQRVLMDVAFTLHAASVRGPQPDVVIAVSPVLLTVLAGLRWRRAGRTALGVVTQDLYGRALRETGMASSRVAAWGARLEGRLLAAADGVAVVHDQFVPTVRNLGVDPDRVTVIPNWSHLPDSTVRLNDVDCVSRTSLRRSFGWGSDEVVALHAGNMGVKQGLENVVEAARRAGPGVRFVLLGDGGRRPALTEAARGVDRLQLLEPLPSARFAEALAAADVLVVNEAPTVAEMSAPSKLTSYFSAGRPVVAACWPHSAAATELHRSGAGPRVDPGEPAALLGAVVALGADPSRRDELGERGRSYAREHLAQTTAHAAYLRWVEMLAATRGETDGPRTDRSDASTHASNEELEGQRWT